MRQLSLEAAVIIIAMTQFLALGFSRIRQPRVIAEVIGGVLLGPTVMGRIPHFREKIFPGMYSISVLLAKTSNMLCVQMTPCQY